MALNNTYNFIKDNITMLALTPTVTGGIWQMTKLLNISPNMIRFFSLSQMISDSVLIVLYFLIPFIGFLILLIDVVYDEEGKSHYSSYERFSIFKKFSLLVIITLVIVFSVRLNEKITINSNKLLLISLISLAGLFTLFRIVFIRLLRKYDTLFSFFITIYFSCNFLIIATSIDNITQNLNDINNFSTLMTKMESEKCYSDKPQIKYFNDKYIFIEVEIKSKKFFVIKKLDDIFIN